MAKLDTLRTQCSFFELWCRFPFLFSLKLGTEHMRHCYLRGELLLRDVASWGLWGGGGGGIPNLICIFVFQLLLSVLYRKRHLNCTRLFLDANTNAASPIFLLCFEVFLSKEVNLNIFCLFGRVRIRYFSLFGANFQTNPLPTRSLDSPLPLLFLSLRFWANLRGIVVVPPPRPPVTTSLLLLRKGALMERILHQWLRALTESDLLKYEQHPKKMPLDVLRTGRRKRWRGAVPSGRVGNWEWGVRFHQSIISNFSAEYGNDPAPRTGYPALTSNQVSWRGQRSSRAWTRPD